MLLQVTRNSKSLENVNLLFHMQNDDKTTIYLGRHIKIPHSYTHMKGETKINSIKTSSKCAGFIFSSGLATRTNDVHSGLTDKNRRPINASVVRDHQTTSWRTVDRFPPSTTLLG